MSSFFRKKDKLGSYKKVCENKDFSSAVLPSEDTKILKFNRYQNSEKIPSIIYADLKSFIKRIDGCKNNFEKSSTTKAGEHILSGYSMKIIWTVDSIENKYDVYSVEDCMKKFGQSLREHAMKIINLEKKKMIPLTSKEYESHLNHTKCHICKKKFKNKYTADKNYCKVRDHYYFAGKYRGAAQIINKLKHSTPTEILGGFHNESFNHSLS